MLKKNLLIIILILGSVISVLGQTVTIGTATTTTSYNPVYSLYGYNYTQQIYTAAEITAGGGAAGMQINAIRFYWAGTGNLVNTNAWTVYLGNSAQATFANTTNWVALASLTSVYSGAVTLPATAGWMTITLTTPYIWNGNNLVVAIDENVPNYGSTAGWNYTTTSTNYRAIYYYSDGTNPDPASPPSGTITYNRPNIQLEMVSLIPCSGTPAPGNALSSSNPACAGVPITLSLSTPPVGAGITFQWQSSPDGTAWTNIPGATSSTYSATISVATHYRCVVTCSAGPSTENSNPVHVTIAPPSSCYCTPGGSSATYYINNFSTTGGSTNITNNGSGFSTGGYGLFTSQTVTQVQNSSVSFSSTMVGGTFGFAIWVDWNQNGTFETTERVYGTTAYAASATGSFMVPLTAVPGNTRMRIKANYLNSAPSNPCLTGFSGEFEDYTFNVVALTSCTGTPAPGNTLSSSNPACSGVPINLSLSTPPIGSGITFQWQSSPDGTAWTNISGATSSTYSATISVATHYRCVVTCSAGPSTENSTPVHVTIAPPSSCYCTPGGSSATYYINNFSTTGGSANITNNGSGFSTGGYGVFTSQTVAQVQNSSVNFSAAMVGGTFGFAIWVDWNQNGTFETTERVYVTTAYAASATGSFTVPLTALPGNTRMRIKANYLNSAPSNPCLTGFSGEFEDYTFNVVALTSCTGTPNNGSASINSSIGCSGTSFTVSAAGVTLGTGISYQWQSSASPTGPFTNLTGGTTSSYATSATVNTYYQLVTTCVNSGLSAISNIVSYTVTGNACQCGTYPAIYPSNTADEEITNVTVGTMNNSSTCTTLGPGPGSIVTRYANYTGFVTGPTVQTGQLVNFSLTQTSCGGSYGNGFQIYIDYNQDGDFADAGEQVYTQPVAATGNHTKTGTFTIPLSANLGITRMRILNNETTFPTATNFTTTTFYYGEVEDYCITIVAATACSATPVGGAASPATQQVSIGTTANLSLTGSTVASGLTYQWQQAVAIGGPYTNVVGGTGATTSNYTTAALSTQTFYRCIVTCTASAESAISVPAEVTTVATTNMFTGTINTCGTILYDSGGAAGNYLANENYTLTVYPSTPGSMIRVIFSSYVTESYEHLYIYDGNSITAPLLGNYSGSASIPTITSTAADGSLTFRFTSDGSVQYAGWVASISCYTNCVYFTPAFTAQGPYCSGFAIPALPTTSNDGVTGVWSPAINNTTTTTYTFTPNPGQCALNTTMTITVNPNTPTTFTPYTSYCPGAVIPALPLTSNGGITGTWSPAIDNTVPTVYTFTADAGVCATTNLTIVIDTFPHGITNNSGTTELTCSMTFISLTATGGNTYSWYGAPPTVLASTAVNALGTYTVTVNNSNGCSDTESITITQNITPPTAAITNNTGTDEFICSVATINLTATGGATYHWSGGSTPTLATNDFTAAGTYYVTVTGSNGCVASTSITLTQVAPLTIVENITDALCFGFTGAADIVVSAGGTAPYSILWDDGNTQFNRSGIPANVLFGYTITDFDLCTTTGDVFVNDPDLLTVAVTGTNVTCYGASNGIADGSNVTGGITPYRFSWNNSEIGISIADLVPGNYSVTVSDANNCTVSSSIVLTQPSEIEITLSSTDAVCGSNGGTITTAVIGGLPTYTYSWSSTGYGGNMVQLAPRVYTLTVTDSNNCTMQESATIGISGQINASILVSHPISCAGVPDGIIEGGSTNGVAPLTYRWNNGAIYGTLSDLLAGTYLLTVTDNWGCQGTASVTLALPDAIILSSSVTNVSCFGFADGKITLGLSGGAPPFVVSWSNGGNDISANLLPPGDYSVLVTDSRNCSVSQDFTVTQPERINLDFTKTDVTCYGFSDGTVSMLATGGSEPYRYSVVNGASIADGKDVSSLQKGNYTLIVRDNNNCYTNANLYIGEPSLIDASVLVSNPSCMGNNDGYIQVVVSGGTEPYKYFYDGIEMPFSTYEGLKEGSYLIEVADMFDCNHSVGKVVLNDSFEDCVNIPNAISPNGDGINDVWEIRNLGDYPGANIQVFNRWGQSVYYGRFNDEPWDATQNGKKVAIGTYVYFVNLNNGVEPYTGTITIIY